MTDNRSIAEAEIIAREKYLAAVPATAQILSLQLFDREGGSLYETAHLFPMETDLPVWASRVFTDNASVHVDALGLNVTEFTSRFTKSYVVGGHVIRANCFSHLYTKGEDGDWDASWRAPTKRFRPFLRIEPEFGGAYIWDQEGVAITLEDLSPDCPEVLKIEAELCDNWQPLFEANASDNPGNRWNPENADWLRPFHAQGLALAIRLKAILQDRADIAYGRPFEDAVTDLPEMQFILPRLLPED